MATIYYKALAHIYLKEDYYYTLLNPIRMRVHFAKIFH